MGIRNAAGHFGRTTDDQFGVQTLFAKDLDYPNCDWTAFPFPASTKEEQPARLSARFGQIGSFFWNELDVCSGRNDLDFLAVQSVGGYSSISRPLRIVVERVRSNRRFSIQI